MIRLTPVAGLDPEETPAIVCCGGRMEFHGTPMPRTWLKLAATAKKGGATVTLVEPPTGWRIGDRVIVTATSRQKVADEGDVPSVRVKAQTEERLIRAVDGSTLTLDAPLGFDHLGVGETRGEVANLSRNVVVESARPGDPKGRGHTMYHRHSAGSISYAEFRHLGKPGILGKYSLHFHRAGDTMRGTSVVGASIWDSGNRWVTIHGTNDLLIRDCVGYGSGGHGFFLEDGTEVGNLLDRNLAVQATAAKPLPGQVMPFDRNEGAGFWWANSGNAFTRNVAVECDQYGYRYDLRASAGFDPVLPVRDASASSERALRDVRTIPLLRFEANEAHAQRRYGLNLGGGDGQGLASGVDGVGPDLKHPSVVKDLAVWDAHWGFTPAAPGLLIDGMTMANIEFGLWRPRYDRHAYRDMRFFRVKWSSFAETGARPANEVYPGGLNPVDDRPPTSVILSARREGDSVKVRGVAIDGGAIRSVVVNGAAAKLGGWKGVDWEVSVPCSPGTPLTIEARAEDAAGNVEARPHRIVVSAP